MHIDFSYQHHAVVFTMLALFGLFQLASWFVRGTNRAVRTYGQWERQRAHRAFITKMCS